MLTKIPLSADAVPKIKKYVSGRDASSCGAFPCGDKIEFTVDVPRILGASAVVMRIAEDGGTDSDIPLDYTDTKNGVDVYQTVIDTAELCHGKDNGLFYYEFLFLRGYDTLFTDTYNFVDFTLETCSYGRFILLVHAPDYRTPRWFPGRVMYHIFVDRFCKGKGTVGARDDAVINGDWYGGTVQYPEKRGDRLENNMFFGGNLWGIAEKLPYLKSLGVGVIYLSPIFKAYSNHKYDTGDYLKIDEMFGGEEAFENLLKKAEEYDIKIILDGVFNHTGDDSLYFDRYGKYGGTGAYSNPNSKYLNWYKFRKYPDEYENWWGIEILPKLNHGVPECRHFFTGEGGVAEKYIKMGISGWRLDVADELSDEFLDEFRQTVKRASDGEGVIIGEVWENAAEKIAYSKRRRYLRGAQLDSVMNYPLRNGIISLLTDNDAELLADILKSVYASYPKCVCDSLMNVLGTHDTERILTVLGSRGEDVSDMSNAELADKRLSEAERQRGIEMQSVAAVIQYTVYGVPSVFYGDEAGVEGYGDPFCRRPFPWGRECKELLALYERLGKMRAEHSVFAEGDFAVEYVEGAHLVYTRTNADERITVAVNAGSTPFEYPASPQKDILTGKDYNGSVPPMRAVVLM